MVNGNNANKLAAIEDRRKVFKFIIIWSTYWEFFLLRFNFKFLGLTKNIAAPVTRLTLAKKLMRLYSKSGVGFLTLVGVITENDNIFCWALLHDSVVEYIL